MAQGDNQASDNLKQKNFFNQLSLAVALSSAMLSNGLTVGYPAVALPVMQTNVSVVVINDQQASWIASLPQLTTLVGCLCVGPLIDRCGRKPGTLLATIISSAGWLVLGITNEVWLVYLGRLLCGLGMGIGSTAVSVLLTELAEPAHRAPFTMAKNVSFSLGLTLVYSLGFAFKSDWQMLGILCSAVPISSTLFILLMVPESRVWANFNAKSKNGGTNNWKHLWKARQRPEVYKPAMFIGVFFFLRQMAGTSVILTYAVSVANAAGVDGDGYLVAVGLGCARTVAGLLAAGASFRWGRRAPVTYAGSLMSFAMIWIAYNSPAELSPSSPPSIWTSRIAAPLLLIVFVLSSTIASDVPRSMTSEIFPTDVRGMATAAGLCITYLSSFLSLKIYPALLIGLGRRGLFTVYAILSVASTIWSIVLLPETNGMTLKQIERMYTGAKSIEVEPERHPLNRELEATAQPVYRIKLECDLSEGTKGSPHPDLSRLKTIEPKNAVP